jgi:hypothetical protein
VPAITFVTGVEGRSSAVDRLAGYGPVTTIADGERWVALQIPPAGDSALPAALIVALIAGVTGVAAARISAVGAGRRETTGVAEPFHRERQSQGRTARPAFGSNAYGNGSDGRATVATLPDDHPHAPSMPDPKIRQLADQRLALVRGLADLVVQLPDDLVWQANNTLREGGVHPLVPDGQRFDPTVHHAVGTETTSDAGSVDTVARTVRTGYADDRRVLIAPRVVVYTDEPGRKGVSP